MDDQLPRLHIGHIEAGKHRCFAEFSDHSSTGVFFDICNDDAGTFLDETLRGSPSEATRSSRDEGTFPTMRSPIPFPPMT